MTAAHSGESSVLTALEDRGHRITGPRREVVRLLEQKCDAFTAEELCAGLPRVGRATIYRTLKVLLDAGVLCKLALPDGSPKYAVAQMGHHHHTVCLQCGAVGDFRGPSLERILRSIGQEIEGRILEHRIELYIQCSACLAPS